MNRFLYSLNGSTIRPTPILEKIKAAAAAGFDGIELWHDDIDSFLQTGGSLDTLRSVLDDQGLTVPTTIYLGDWFDADDLAWSGVLDECRRRMKQAAAVGAPHVIAGPPSGVANYVLGSKRYRQLLEAGAELGVKPAIEFLGFVEQVNTIEQAIEIMHLSGHPDATTVLDPFHIWRGGGSVESIANLGARQIAIAHFNDTVTSPAREHQHDSDRVMPGDGCFDLERYLGLLDQIGYRGWLSLELFREDLWSRDPVEVARVGFGKMCAVTQD